MKRRKLHRHSFIHRYVMYTYSITILVISGVFDGLFRVPLYQCRGYRTAFQHLDDGAGRHGSVQLFINQFFWASWLIVVVFLFGTSLAGIPIISFNRLYQGVQIGFSCALFLYTYQFKGVLGSS